NVKSGASDFFPALRVLKPGSRISSPHRERKIRDFGFLPRAASVKTGVPDFFLEPRAKKYTVQYF
ncbi:MAG: hypothetical protein LBK22_02330, partial [Tannerella sp.]|nr:hypothetical protein [Tannerella sp.]